MSKIADDAASIAARLKEIQEEKLQAIMGVPIEDPQPVEAPKDVDWSAVYGMYGNPNATTVAAMQELDSDRGVKLYPLGTSLVSASVLAQVAEAVESMSPENRAKIPDFIAQLGQHLAADWRKDYGL